jgi:hypothetical protein
LPALGIAGSVKGHIGTVMRANYHTPELGTPYSSGAEERMMADGGRGRSSLSVEGCGH